eukprot:TRINITY_DN927_c0_g1_i2.p1 TRINITY_DN927_c0_g1~~TRINITY_DN927_c0_g1_i2.p1  ORF type:complete len:378 (-),score=74.29 TRINITY_DN927_c0_g1_i2:118-1251(-)
MEISDFDRELELVAPRINPRPSVAPSVSVRSQSLDAEDDEGILVTSNQKKEDSKLAQVPDDDEDEMLDWVPLPKSASSSNPAKKDNAPVAVDIASAYTKVDSVSSPSARPQPSSLHVLFSRLANPPATSALAQSVSNQIKTPVAPPATTTIAVARPSMADVDEFGFRGEDNAVARPLSAVKRKTFHYAPQAPRGPLAIQQSRKPSIFSAGAKSAGAVPPATTTTTAAAAHNASDEEDEKESLGDYGRARNAERHVLGAPKKRDVPMPQPDGMSDMEYAAALDRYFQEEEKAKDEYDAALAEYLQRIENDDNFNKPRNRPEPPQQQQQQRAQADWQSVSPKPGISLWRTAEAQPLGALPAQKKAKLLDCTCDDCARKT